MTDSTETFDRIEKVCPVVLRQNGETISILAFKHPEAGNQIVKGTLENGEAPIDAAMRELGEESGLSVSARPVDLGKSKGIEKQESWHFFVCPISGAPETWVHHAPDDAGKDFAFFWQSLSEFVDEDEWHPVFIRAIRFVQGKLERMDETNRARLFPPKRNGLADTIISMVAERGGDKSLCPSEVARHVAGTDEQKWRALMKPIRAETVRLAKQGQVTITRKGKPVDPDDFKGVYRITTTH